MLWSLGLPMGMALFWGEGGELYTWGEGLVEQNTLERGGFEAEQNLLFRVFHIHELVHRNL